MSHYNSVCVLVLVDSRPLAQSRPSPVSTFKRLLKTFLFNAAYGSDELAIILMIVTLLYKLCSYIYFVFYTIF